MGSKASFAVHCGTPGTHVLSSDKPCRAELKVEQKQRKMKKCSTIGSKFGPCDLESSKISKSNVLTVIEQVMSSTAFGKITAVYGHIDENGRFVRKMRFDYGQISKK